MEGHPYTTSSHHRCQRDLITDRWFETVTEEAAMYPVRRMRGAEVELEYLLRRVDRAVSGAEFESATADPAIVDLCREANALANRLREQMRGASPQERIRLRNEGSRWIRDKTRQWGPRMRSLSVSDLDGLNGCIARVAHGIGQQTRRLRRFGQRSQRRMPRSVMHGRVRRITRENNAACN